MPSRRWTFASQHLVAPPASPKNTFGTRKQGMGLNFGGQKNKRNIKHPPANLFEWNHKHFTKSGRVSFKSQDLCFQSWQVPSLKLTSRAWKYPKTKRRTSLPFPLLFQGRTVELRGRKSFSLNSYAAGSGSLPSCHRVFRESHGAVGSGHHDTLKMTGTWLANQLMVN